MGKVTLKVGVFEDVKAAVDAIADEKRLSTSAWVQSVLLEAIEQHRVKKARMAAVAGYNGEAPL